jgi:hypothetical protein
MRLLLVLLVATGCSHLHGDPALPDASPDAVVCPGANLQTCGVRDGGFEVSCADGQVTAQDLTAVLYCRPGETTVLCESEPQLPMQLRTCASGCADTAVHHFDTLDEYRAFDPASTCR